MTLLYHRSYVFDKNCTCMAFAAERQKIPTTIQNDKESTNASASSIFSNPQVVARKIFLCLY